MKKFVKVLLVLLVAVCSASLSIEHHTHEAHAYSEGQVYGSCPDCHRANAFIIVELIKDATCTASGRAYCKCGYCDFGREVTLSPKGHNYGNMTVQKAATCTESGTGKYTCKRCGHVKTETIKALGHKYTYTDIEATCTEEGHHTATCSRCGDIIDEVFPALGHDFTEYALKTPATCEEDGLQEAICKRCSLVDQQVIPATGHAFPEEWTIVKEPGVLVKGLRQKVCANCGKVIEEVLPAKLPAPVVIIIAGGTAAVAAGLLILKKIKAARKIFKPKVETKTVVVRSDNEDLIKLLKDRLYLSVSACDEDKLLETVEDKEPDLLICQISSQKKLKDLLKEKREQIKALEEAEKKKKENKEKAEDEEEPNTALAETPIGLIMKADTIKAAEKTLKKAMDDELISGYVSDDNDIHNTFVKFVLPVLKPDLKSDESLENFGNIADLLGIPGISELISVYTSGRDIKATLEEGELGVSGTATIIADIASILGLETVESIAGLVDDVETISKAVEEESGAHEQKKGISAIKDIAEVVSDIAGDQ